MATYNLPRNVNGEGRILFIFTNKSFLWTVGGLGIGIIFSLFFSLLKLKFIGMIVCLIFALIGFLIGTLKIPNISTWKATKTISGEKVDDIILRAIKFKIKKKIYINDYKEEKTKDGE